MIDHILRPSFFDSFDAIFSTIAHGRPVRLHLLIEGGRPAPLIPSLLRVYESLPIILNSFRSKRSRHHPLWHHYLGRVIV